MARSGQRDIEQLKSLFTEMGRIQLAFASGDYRPDPEDLFCGIRSPDGRGDIPTGRAGRAALNELALSAIKAAGLQGRVSEDIARDALGPILVRTFKTDRLPIEPRSLQKAFGEAARLMRKTLVSRTYLIPCHLMDTAEPDDIRLGPVSFLNRAAMRRMFLSASPSRTDGEWTGDARQMIAQAMRHYRSYRWVAAVRIEDCAPELAKRYAMSAATLALSGLQLFFGARASRRMAIGGRPQGWVREAEMQLTDVGALAVSISHAFNSGEGFEKGWAVELEAAGMRRGMALFGLALEASLPSEKRPLSERVLGAAQWFGEAVREASPATQLIKFITAIEHIVLTGEKLAVTRLMAERVAALLYEIGSASSRREVTKDFLRLYAFRSKLMHGSMSPWDPDIPRNLGPAADLAEQVFHAVLGAWGEDGLRSQRATSRRLAGWYDQAVWQMKLDTEPVAHVETWLAERRKPATDA